MNDTDVRISKDEYLRLVRVESDYHELCRQRDAERELFDRLHEHRIKNGKFTGILQTRDILQCYVEDKVIDSTAYTPVAGQPRRIFFQLQYPAGGERGMPLGAELPARENRGYVETELRINGLPVFQEVDPRTSP